MSRSNWKNIYAMKSDDGYVKIGISKNPEKRAKSLENRKFKVVDVFYTEPCSNPYTIERICHEKLSSKRVFGEWFNVDFEKAKEVVSQTFSQSAVFNERDINPEVVSSVFGNTGISDETTAVLAEICFHQNEIIAEMSASIKKLSSTVEEMQSMLMECIVLGMIDKDISQ